MSAKVFRFREAARHKIIVGANTPADAVNSQAGQIDVFSLAGIPNEPVVPRYGVGRPAPCEPSARAAR